MDKHTKIGGKKTALKLTSNPGIREGIKPPLAIGIHTHHVRGPRLEF